MDDTTGQSVLYSLHFNAASAKFEEIIQLGKINYHSHKYICINDFESPSANLDDRPFDRDYLNTPSL